jgi:hypothetical protein
VATHPLVAQCSTASGATRQGVSTQGKKGGRKLAIKNWKREIKKLKLKTGDWKNWSLERLETTIKETRKQETRNKKPKTGYWKLEKKWEMRNRERGTGNGERGTEQSSI